MATYWENSCSFGLRYASWYKYLIVSLVFSHLGFWSGNLFLIAPFPDLCLLVPFSIHNASLIIGGDFNFPGWDWKSKSIKPRATHKVLHQRFSDIIDDSGLVQVVEEPTRKDNTLDLFLTNRPNKVLRVDVLPGVSDHDMVFLELDMRPVKQKQKSRKVPIYRKAEWDLMKEDMKSLHTDLEAMYDSDSIRVNDMWEKFRDTLQQSIDDHFRHRQSKPKDGYPWIGHELKKMMKRLHRYYKTKKKTGDPRHIRRYLDLKHQLQKKQRQAYWEYVRSIVTPQDQENEYAGMKRFWTYIKHRRSDNVGVSSLKSEGKLFSHSIDKADILNKQFQSVFSSSEKISKEDFCKHYPMPTTDDQFPVIDNIEITLNGVIKLLRALNPTKSPGPDNLGPRVLKELALEIGPLLLLIYKKSLQTSEIPEDWRKANVTPVFKKGQRYQAENYRPISLTSVCCKTMEHIVTSTIMNHGEDNNILYPPATWLQKIKIM